MNFISMQSFFYSIGINKINDKKAEIIYSVMLLHMKL